MSRLLNRTIAELVAKNQSTTSRLQCSLDRLAGINAENQSLKAALKTSASSSGSPVSAETRCQHRGNASQLSMCILCFNVNVLPIKALTL